MKGLVFTTFYDFCEVRFGEEVLDEVITLSNVPRGGAYTSVGSYPFREMVALTSALSTTTGMSTPQLLEAFGEHCFACWVSYSPAFFAGRDLFDVLSEVDHFHDNEVRKLYPDAELPSFEVAERGPSQLHLRYRSCKPLANLAVGVIRGAARHLGTPVEIHHAIATDLDDPHVRFTITRTN
jgi:hypothetical protein